MITVDVIKVKETLEVDNTIFTKGDVFHGQFNYSSGFKKDGFGRPIQLNLVIIYKNGIHLLDKDYFELIEPKSQK